MRARAALAAAALALVAVPARAAEPDVDFIARAAFLLSSGHGSTRSAATGTAGGAFEGNGELAVLGRFGSYLRVGGYIGYAAGSVDLDGAFANSVRRTRYGLRLEGHLRPLAIVDPWAGLEVGAFHAATRFNENPGSGTDGTFELGVDFHIRPIIAVGVAALVQTPLSSRGLYDGSGHPTGVLFSPIPYGRAVLSF